MATSPTKDQLVAAIQKAAAAGDNAAANELAGYLEEVYGSGGPTPDDIPAEGSLGEQLAQRGANIQDIQERAKAGEMNYLQSGLRQMGQGAAAASDVLGAGIETAIEKSAPLVSRAREQYPVAATAADLALNLAKNTRVVDLFGRVKDLSQEEYSIWKKKNPDLAEDVEAAFNIAQWVGPMKPSQGKTKIGQIGDELGAAATRQTAEERAGWLSELLEPKDTPANRRERVSRMSQDEKGRNVYNPSQEEIEMNRVLKRSKVNPKNSLVGNLRVIDGDIETTANLLDKRLAKSDVRINTQELLDDFDLEIERLASESPVLVGDAAGVATRIFDKARDLLAKSNGSPLSVLNVRRDLDKWIKQQGKDKYDGFENAYTVAQRAVRDLLNVKVAEAVPDAKVREALRRQHLLFRASDRVAEKAADEADTRLGRAVQNVLAATNSSLPKTPLARLATVVGAGSAAAALMNSALFPYLASGAVAGTLGYAVRRGTMSASTKRALSVALKGIDKALTTTKSDVILSQLRADRAFIIELMKLPLQQQTPQEQAAEEAEVGGIPLRNFGGAE